MGVSRNMTSTWPLIRLQESSADLYALAFGQPTSHPLSAILQFPIIADARSEEFLLSLRTKYAGRHSRTLSAAQQGRA